MKKQNLFKNSIFSLIGCICFCNAAYSANYMSYETRLDELEKQIKELKIKTSSNNNPAILTGRLSALGSFYTADSDDSMKNKLSIRTARLGVIKSVDDFMFYAEANYNGNNPRGNSVSLGQAFINYTINSTNEVRVGQLLPPAFMENEKNANILQTSGFSPWLGFIPADNYFVGADYLYTGSKGGISTGVFGNSNQESNTTAFNENTNVFGAFRGFYTPIRNDNAVIHLGVDTGYSKYDNDSLSEAYYYGFELGIQYKNLTFENEFVKSFHNYKETSDFNKEFKNSSFGFTSQLTIGLTGENRIYDKYGSFGFVKVKRPVSQGGYGAFEGVLKFTRYNGDEVFSEGYGFTVGVNWFPINNVMVLFNYSRNKDSTECNDKGYNAFKLEARMWF